MALEWGDIKVFLAVDEAGSLTKASTRLGLSVATVSRRLERLESQLGRKLFQRHAGGLSLLEDAVELVERARGVQEQVADFLRTATLSGDERLVGTVTVTTIESIITWILAPALADFRRRYPRINLALRATSRVLNLSERAADIAIRLMRPRESYVVAQKVASFRMGLFASKAYLERCGRPELPAFDLRGHDVVTYDQRFDSIPEVAWFHMRCEPEDIALRVTTASAIATAVEAGAGIGLLPTRMEEQRDLVKLWPDETRSDETRSGAEIPVRDLWLAVHKDLQHVPRIRAVFSFLRETLAQIS